MALATPKALDQLKIQPFCQLLEDGTYHLTPTTADQVAWSLHLAQQAEQRIHFTPAETPTSPGRLWLDVSQLRQIRRHRVADFVVTVESGLSIGALQETLKSHGQTFPLHYPPQTILSEILAEDRPALETGFRGYPRDFVLGLEIATPDGQVTHCGGEVVKNVTGYDLNKLYIGSHQTLGVITAVTLKLMAAPESTRCWLFEFQTIQKAFASMQQLLQSDLPLSRCELFHQDRLDPNSSQQGVASWQLLLEIAGDAGLLKQMATVVREMVVYPDAESSLHPAREETLLHMLSSWPPDHVVLELALPKAGLETLYLEVQLLSQTHGLQPLSQLRPAAGLFYLLFPLTNRFESSTFSGFLEALQTKVVQKGGLLQLLQGPANCQAWMAHYNLPEDPGVKGIMKRIKQYYDPQGILFNPRLPLLPQEQPL